MNDNSNPPKTEGHVEVKRGRVISVNLYEVKEDELNILEKGDVGGLFLNLAIFSFSVGFTAASTLITAKFESDLTKIIYAIITVVGIFAGVILVPIWWKNHQSTAKTISKIKERLNGESSSDEIIRSEEDPKIP